MDIGGFIAAAKAVPGAIRGMGALATWLERPMEVAILPYSLAPDQPQFIAQNRRSGDLVCGEMRAFFRLRIINHSDVGPARLREAVVAVQRRRWRYWRYWHETIEEIAVEVPYGVPLRDRDLAPTKELEEDVLAMRAAERGPLPPHIKVLLVLRFAGKQRTIQRPLTGTYTHTPTEAPPPPLPTLPPLSLKSGDPAPPQQPRVLVEHEGVKWWGNRSKGREQVHIEGPLCEKHLTRLLFAPAVKTDTSVYYATDATVPVKDSHVVGSDTGMLHCLLCSSLVELAADPRRVGDAREGASIKAEDRLSDLERRISEYTTAHGALRPQDTSSRGIRMRTERLNAAIVEGVELRNPIESKYRTQTLPPEDRAAVRAYRERTVKMLREIAPLYADDCDQVLSGSEQSREPGTGRAFAAEINQISSVLQTIRWRSEVGELV